MSYIEFKNDQEPDLSSETLNRMQIELMKMIFPIRFYIYYSNQYKSINNIKIWNLGTTKRKTVRRT